MSLDNISDLKLSTTCDLSGRVALVTGGGTGIGLMIAQGFVANGAKVYIAGRREDVLKQVAEKTEGFVPLQMNVTDKSSISECIKVIEERESKLDILVNCAGVVGPISSYLTDKSALENATLGESLFRDQSFEDWSNVFAANTTAPFLVTSAFLSLLEKGAKARGPKETSSVINISSIWGSTKLAFNVLSYGVSKAAQDHLTVTLATEFARNSIPVRVNAIAPGTFPTEMTNTDIAVLDKFTASPIMGGMSATPMRRAGRAHEIASLAVLLSSVGGAYMNGQIIAVDGGHNLVNP